MELSLRAVSLRYGPVYVLLFLSSESCVFLCILHVFTGTCVVAYVSVACKHVSQRFDIISTKTSLKHMAGH